MTPREKNLNDIEHLAEGYGYTVADILGPKRHRHLVFVRNLCVFMLRNKGYSTTEIGRIMNRDHSTIVHALNKGDK
jgi:chromosomal replication initiation ATPase DnaA